jgi:hypothetical protein
MCVFPSHFLGFSGFFEARAASKTVEVWWLGQVTGLWGEMRASRVFAYRDVAPRVLSPQNRMRLTQSPRRASLLLVRRPRLISQDIQSNTRVRVGSKAVCANTSL